jgi:hypothetical protein
MAEDDKSARKCGRKKDPDLHQDDVVAWSGPDLTPSSPRRIGEEKNIIVFLLTS